MSGNKKGEKGSSGSRPSSEGKRSTITTESRIDMLNKHKYSELVRNYLAGVVDPMRATRMPDVTTTSPTGLLTYEETGTLASDATGAVGFGLFPSYDAPLAMNAGTITWGVPTTGPPARYRFTQAGAQRGNIVSFRVVSYAVELKGAQSFNNATGNYAVAVVPRYNSTIVPWNVSNLSQLPGAKIGTVPASTMEAFNYYGTLHSGEEIGNDGAGGQMTGALFDPNQFRILPADLAAVIAIIEPSDAAPGLVFACEGAPASSTVFQITVRYAYEVVVNNNSVPTDTVRPPTAAAEMATLVGHPAVRTAIESKPARASFLQNGMSWLWNHRGEIAGGAAKFAAAAAPLLPLVL